MLVSSLRFNTYKIDDSTGYGVVARDLLGALHKYTDLDIFEKSKNILNFCKAEHYKFGNLTIGYTPWESTEVPDNWRSNMAKVDDLWTTSTWIAKVFERITDRECFVLPHGINEEWATIRHHGQEGPFTFVHVGEPAIRKGGDVTLNAWYRHFQNNSNVQLIFKCRGHTAGRIYDDQGSIIGSAQNIGNVHTITETYDLAEIWRLYALSDCMIYPSRGEGFGLIPFEAIACGLPTILPGNAIGDFYYYGNPLWNTSFVESDDQIIHPGSWLSFDEDEIIYKMESVMSDYENHAYNAYQAGKTIHKKFNWRNIIYQALDRLELILP